jgi:4-hydroxy-tetrahydrodipicolinate reductase
MNKREKRNKKEIGFSAIRGGNVVGEHTVQFFSDNETLEITHKSYSRQVFAEGALKAARFVATKPKGLYSMKDLV